MQVKKKRDDSKKKAIRWGDMLDRINAVRGEDEPFAAWVKDACEAKLKQYDHNKEGIQS